MTAGRVARPRPRWGRIALGVLGGCALLWHFLPLLVWHLGARHWLAAQSQGDRLRVHTERALPTPPAEWSAVTLDGLGFALPSQARLAPECGPVEARCFIELTGGTLTVLPQGDLEPWREMVNLRAPDERDLSAWRWADANWATIRALRERVETSRGRLDSWRFETPALRGVVAHTLRESRSRWIVAAYRRDGRGERALAVAGLPREALLGLIASLRIGEPGLRNGGGGLGAR